MPSRAGVPEGAELPAEAPLSPLIAHLLAKSHKEARGAWRAQPEEKLEEHTFLVVQRLAGLMRRAPHMTEIAGRKDFWHIAFWAAVIHDFGKSALGFQDMLKGGGRFEWRHEVLSLAFLSDVSDPETKKALALAVISHHRDAEFFRKNYYSLAKKQINSRIVKKLLKNLRDDDIKALRQWLLTEAEHWRIHMDFHKYDVQPRRSYDALGIDVDIQEMMEEALIEYIFINHHLVETDVPWLVLLRGLIQQADRLASAHAPVPQPFYLPDEKQLAEVKGFIDFRPHQKAAARAGHLILTAPTGSGKTEAALLWAYSQQKELGACRLTYALPYQASLNAMQKRLEQDLKTEVSILHGRALQVLFHAVLNDSDGENTDELMQAATLKAREANDFNRLHGPAVAVATPYQLLRVAYCLPGYETILANVAGSALVLDEIHAYDPRRLGMFMALLQDLVRRWSVRACVISATMPSWLGQKLEDILEIKTLTAPPEIALKNCRHRIRLCGGNLEDEDILDEIAHRVSHGESLLVAVNTVFKGQLIMQKLQERLQPQQVRLLHSRLNGGDRRAREQEILEHLQAGQQNKQPIVVVATQVIEVSLDLDFDGIYSEPAPLEALIQRFGRVNRRGQKGKSVDLKGHQVQVVDVHVMTHPTDGQGIYNDLLVQRSLEILQECVESDGLLHDDLLNDWLERIYSGDALNELLEEYEKGYREVAKYMSQLKPFNSQKDLQNAFEELFDGLEVLPKCFEKEYARARASSPIAAQDWLVPVNFQQKARFRAFFSFHEQWNVWIADLEYDEVLGLILRKPTEQPKRTDDWGEL